MPTDAASQCHHPGTVLRRREALASGMAVGDYRRSARSLERLTAGTYADLLGLTDEAAHEVRARAVLARLSGVALSHVSAAVLWDLPVMRRHLDTVHLTRMGTRAGRPKNRPAYRLHPGPIRAEEHRSRRDVPITAPARTVTDCARLLGTDWGVVLADAALRRGLVDLDELERRAREVRRLHGAERARALQGLTSQLAESPGESLLRLQLIRLQRPPREQVQLLDVQDVPRVDFLVGRWLVIEFDGRAKYGIGGDPAAAHWAEKRRQDPMVEVGYEVVRVVWAELGDAFGLERRILAAERRIVARHGPGALGRT
jgi:hypothetical protein